MEQGFSNRIGGLIGEDHSVVAVRSPAQRQASRRNGAVSRGPVTAEGKAKSRLNSLKHGLLARVLVPPADFRNHHRLYIQIRRELIEELQPATFTQRAAVDALARDYVQLARAGAMTEALQQTAAPVDDDLAKRWDQVVEARNAVRAMAAAQKLLLGSDLPGCKSPAADLVAGRIVDAVEQLRADLTPSEDDVPEDELNDFERAELQNLKEQWAKVRPPRDEMPAKTRIAAVLRGDKRPAAAERKWLRRVLEYVAEATRAWIGTQEDVRRQVEGRQAASLAALASKPDHLMLLFRYERAIQKMIDDRLKGFPRAR